MPKKIKKYYHFLDLPYNSSIEEIQSREKVLIKTLRAKAIKTGVSCTEKINKVVNAANNILGYVEKNGVPNGVGYLYNTPLSTLYTQIFVFALVIITAVCSVISLIITD